MSEENSSLITKDQQRPRYETTESSPASTVHSNNSESEPEAQTDITSSIPSDNSSTSQSSDPMRSSLSFLSKIGFGFGHIVNDLCAGVWFSYTLLFMKKALLLPGPEAGALMMIGQVGDALATPIVGYLADRFGTKRQWHLFGKLYYLKSSTGDDRMSHGLFL